MRDTEEKFYSGIGKVAAGTALTALVGIIFHPLLVRLLGTEQYGSLAVALAVFSVLSHFFLFGMRESTRKHLTQYPNKKSVISSFTFGFLVLIGVIPVIVFFLSSHIQGLLSSYFPGASGLILLTLPALFSMNVYKGLRSILYGLYMEGRGEVVTATGRTIFYVGSIVVVVYGLGAEGVVYWLGVYPLLMSALVAKILTGRVDISLKKLSESHRLAGEMFSYGALTLVSVLFMQLHLQADILFVNFFEGSTDAGIYKGAVVAVNFIWMVPAALQKVLLHSYSDMASEGKSREVKKYTVRAARLVLPLLTLIAVGMISLSGDFMRIYYGNQFYRGAAALSVLAAGAVFAGLAKTVSSALEASGGIRSSAAAVASASILNLVLNAFLVPKYGLNGAAVATAFSYASLFFLYEKVFRRRDVNLVRSMQWKSVLVAAVAAFLTLEAGKAVFSGPYLRLLLLPPAASAVFATVALRLSVVTSQELEKVLKPLIPVRGNRLFWLIRRLEG